MAPEAMHQEAPYPAVLADVVRRLEYVPDGRRWHFALADLDRGQGSRGLTLVITITGRDSYSDRIITVNHYMLVPPAAYDERSWTWWLFQQVSLVEQHERMEWFKIGGRPVYPPAHGPGNDPYLILGYGSDLDRRTAYTGAVNPA